MRLTFTLPLAALALVATAAGWAQTTRPESKLPVIKARVWTCPDHEQFRLRAKGQCPVCQKTLTRATVVIAGPDVTGDPYPLETCPVSGIALGEIGPPIIMMHEGREVRFCSAGCIKKFDADAQKYLAAVDRAIIEQQRDHYPLASCPVSRQPLDAMGGPVDYVYNNRLVRFCCNGCVRGFTKNPAKFLGTLNEAVIEQQMADYPLTTCPISNQSLDAMGGAVDMIIANRLVRFCCAGCANTFYKAPAVHLAKLEKAWEHEG